jgi:sugar transferase (PEP-CTERM/EpsH1 system associated)
MTEPDAGPKPTICQLLHSLRVGGAEVLAARLARQLGQKYRFLFACLDELGSLGAELRGDGFRVEVLERRPGLDWRCAWRLAHLLRHDKVALVHAHQYTPFFYTLAARLLGRRRPILFTEHGRHFPDYPRRKRMLVNRLLLRHRDRVVGVGGAVREALIQNEGIPRCRVEVIYNGIDLSPFRTSTHDREAVRRELGVGPHDLVLLQVARLDYLKDHATAVRALEKIVQQRPNARLVLVGEGPEESKIRDEVQRRGLTGAVHFLGLRTDVAQLLGGADLFLLTSISEGIPLTVIEAMAAGLSVVATRVGGVGEVIVEGETGLLAPAEDDGELARLVLRLAQDPAFRAHLGENGRARAKAIFSEEHMHAGYVRLYEEMLRG